MGFEAALSLFLVAVLAGSMLFFAAVVAPQVFRSLPADQAGVFLRALFPNYYLWGLIVSVAATLAALAYSGTISLLCGIVALLFLFARQQLMPRINAARDAALASDSASDRRFARLHRASVIINVIQLLALLGIAASILSG